MILRPPPSPHRKTFFRSSNVRLTVVALALLAALVSGSGRFLRPEAARAVGENAIFSINVIRVTSTFATVTWSTTLPSDSKVDYGLSDSYGSSVYSKNDPAGSVVHTKDLAPLDPNATYHFKITSEAFPLGSGDRAESVDRTFHTPSSSSAGPPTISEFSAERGYTELKVKIVTDRPTHVQIKYGKTTAYEIIPPAEDGPGVYLQSRTLTIGSLQPDTEYHLQATATDTFGNSFTSGDTVFRTTISPDDHFFDTGGCPDGTKIGECNGAKQFCDGGTLRSDCTKCGISCAPNETCQAGGSCAADEALTGSPYQCNTDQCYDNQAFKHPAAPGCWKSWPRCTANVVLKVKRDRVCDQWLTCSASQEITNDRTGQKEDLCLGLAGCSSLGPGGTCNSPFGQGQCDNDPLKFCNIDNDCNGGTCITVTKSSEHYRPVTYRTPQEVGKIQNLSGSIKAGLDWGKAKEIIEGMYPWFLMPQWGETLLKEVNEKGDFEYLARAGIARGEVTDKLDPFISPTKTGFDSKSISLEAEPGSEQGQKNLNHVLKVKPTKDSTTAYLQAPAGDDGFTAFPFLDYFVKLRLKSASGQRIVRVQFAYGDPVRYKTLGDAVASSGELREFTFGPANGVDGEAWLRLFFPPGTCDGDLNGATGCTVTGADDPASCGAFAATTLHCTALTSESEVMIDDVSVTAVLEVRPSQYVFPSCRLYPKEDAETCLFLDQNGVKYTGQTGYCLERDPRNSSICISWWPVDAVRGDVNAFGTEESAGFNVSPLYYCAQEREYVELPNEYEDGCVPSWNGIAGCSTAQCKINNPNPCQVGYHLDDNYVGAVNATWDPAPAKGFKCPRDLEYGSAIFNLCARSGFGNDQCAFKCVKDSPSRDDQPLATIEYTGAEKILPGANLVNQCAVIAKVSDTGANKAWVERLLKSSDYEAPPPPAKFPLSPLSPALVERYKVSGAQGGIKDYLIDYPFGRLVEPADQNDPTDWLPVQIRSTCENPTGAKPLLCPSGETSGVMAGAPAPYAWTKNANMPAASCNIKLTDAECNGNSYCDLQPSKCATSSAECRTNAGCNTGVACIYNPDPNPLPKCSISKVDCKLKPVCSNNISVTCTKPNLPDPVCGGKCFLAEVPCAGNADCLGMPGDYCDIPVCMSPDYQCNQDWDAKTAGNQPVDCVEVAVGIKQCTNDWGTSSAQEFITGADRHGYCTKLDKTRDSTKTCFHDYECNTVSYCKEHEVEVKRGTIVTQRHCTDSSGAPTGHICQIDSDCSYCALPKLCTVADDCYTDSCVPPAAGGGTCSGGPKNGLACKTQEDCFDAANACSAASSNCKGGSTGWMTCQADRDCVELRCDSVEIACTVYRKDQRGYQVEHISDAVERLRMLFAAQYGVWYLKTSPTAYPEYVKCPGGDPICNTLAYSDPGMYVDKNLASELQAWKPPDQVCPLDASGRPKRPNPPADDCGVPPRIFNAKWKSGASSITVNRGEMAVLTFNSFADPEQKPLKQIYIDWSGNRSDIQPIPFPYDSKGDPKSPHVLGHAFWNSTNSPLVFKPRALLMDNWGWCNNGVGGQPCDPTALWLPLVDADGKQIEITVR